MLYKASCAGNRLRTQLAKCPQKPGTPTPPSRPERDLSTVQEQKYPPKDYKP